MKKFLGWVFFIVIILILIGQVRWYSVGISTTEDPIEVPPRNWVAQMLKVDETYDEEVEAKLNVRHISGPPVDIYVLNKNGFNLFENNGKEIVGVGGDKLQYFGRIVSDENFRPINKNFELTKFNGQIDTDWIGIGTQETLYLVLSSRDSERSASIEAVLTVRDD